MARLACARERHPRLSVRRTQEQNSSARSQSAVDRNGQQKFQKDFVVKGAKRRLRRSETLDNKILLKHTAAVAIDGFL
jgi:hypothetical protein